MLTMMQSFQKTLRYLTWYIGGMITSGDPVICEITLTTVV